MRKAKAVAATAALGMICFSWPGQAQTQDTTVEQASRELGECLVGSTTGNDRILVARWMAAALASSPRMQGLIAVDADAKDKVDRAMGALFSRLMASDCLSEAKTLAGFRDMQAMEGAGGKLGEVAMQELMRDPATLQALLKYVDYVDEAALTALTP